MSQRILLDTALKSARSAIAANDMAAARVICEEILEGAPGHPETVGLLIR